MKDHKDAQPGINNHTFYIAFRFSARVIFFAGFFEGQQVAGLSQDEQFISCLLIRVICLCFSARERQRP